jgi:hypothetical protein
MCSGITVKLSFVVFAALAIVAALAAWVWTVGTGIRQHTRTIFTGWVWGALLVVPWLVRHVILSGYLLYPSTWISFPVKWKIPHAMAEPIAAGITAWARELGSGTINPDQWFGNWFFVFPFEMKEAVVYAVLILAAVVVLRYSLRLKPVQWRGVLIVLACHLLSLLYWFWMAPALRFIRSVVLVDDRAWIAFTVWTVEPIEGCPVSTYAAGFILLLLMFWLSPDFKSVSMQPP